MSKKVLSLLFAGLLTLSFAACTGEEKTDETKDKDDKTVEETEENEETTEEVTHEPGEIPFDYPTVATTAKAGDTVLVPPMETLEEAWANEGSAVFIFYSAEMVEPGEVESKVKNAFDEEYMVPNSLIVKVGEDAEAEVGDIVTTWWQSGSGMMKAIVTQAGATPTVRYLDDFIEEEDQLEANSFNILEGDLEPGVSVAVKSDGYLDHAVVIHVSDDKVLLNGFAGSISVADKEDVTPMPSALDLSAGDTVWAPVIGTYDTVTVKEVKADIGQIVAEYEWAGEMTEETFVFGEIAPEGHLSE